VKSRIPSHPGLNMSSRRLSFTRLTLSQQPLLFVAISFICGLLLAARHPISVRHWLIFCATAWVAASIALWLSVNGHAAVALSICGCFAAGGALWTINEEATGENSVRRLFERGELRIDEPIEIWGQLNAAPELAPDRIYLSIAVERVATLGRELRSSGTVSLIAPFNDHESRLEYDSLALDYGTRVRLLAHLGNRSGYLNPGAPDFDQLLEYRGYDATGSVKSPLLIERLGEGEPNPILAPILERLYLIRARALAVILRHFKQPASGILAAALFGNRYFLARDTAEAFRAGGTFHLLVISGLHVAMIAIVALWLAKYLSGSRLIQYAIVLALMWAYALMVGAQPAVTRSAVMLSIVLIGQSIFRKSAGANALAASAIVLLCWQPRDLFNPGFQLSFLTVLMIVALTGPLYTRFKQIGEWQPTALTPYPPRVPGFVKKFAEVLFWNEVGFREKMKAERIRYRLDKAPAACWVNEMRLQRPLAWIAVTIFTTTGVQIGLLPLMVVQFHRVSIVAPVTNVIEGALIFALMLAGALYLVFHSIVGGIAQKLAGVVNALGAFSVESCEPLLALRWANLRVPDLQPAPLVFSVFLIAVLILIIVINEWNPVRRGDEPNTRRRMIAGRGLAIASSFMIIVLSWLLILHPFEHRYERGRLSVTFLDVGQGDSMLIAFPEGSLMMLDAGGRLSPGAGYSNDDNEHLFIEDRIGIAESAVMPYLWHRGIKKLDWIVASHGDADHVEGFTGIIQSFAIGLSLGEAREFDQAGLPSRIARRGDRFEIDGARVKVLSPLPEANGTPLSDNNGSLVIKITYGSRSFLLAGDIEREAEAVLVASGADLSADVLKVAHHGSKTSSTFEFLKKVCPRHAVISAANPSPYGHPHAEVVERLRESGARIWQTSACGAITISTDGQDLHAGTFIKCE
jgi:competence protein ComEC